jgi:hypothetical protein
VAQAVTIAPPDEPPKPCVGGLPRHQRDAGIVAAHFEGQYPQIGIEIGFPRNAGAHGVGVGVVEAADEQSVFVPITPCARGCRRQQRYRAVEMVDLDENLATQISPMSLWRRTNADVQRSERSMPRPRALAASLATVFR